MKDLFPFDIIWVTIQSPHAPAGTSTPWLETAGGHQACGNTAGGQVPPVSLSYLHHLLTKAPPGLRLILRKNAKKMTHTRSWVQSALLKSLPPLFPASMCWRPNGPDVLLTDGVSHVSYDPEVYCCVYCGLRREFGRWVSGKRVRSRLSAVPSSGGREHSAYCRQAKFWS